jgi:hypothetical protein
MSSHSREKARILQVSSTKRSPAFTKKLIRPTTCGISAAGTWPESRTASSTAMAVDKAYATSCTGVAPASCKWYEQTLMGFQRGTWRTV